MLSPVYTKAKDEIKNLSDINFNESQWQWYYEEGVKKKLDQLVERERLLLEALVRVKRAQNLISIL